ncbi:hypothetical protein ACNKHO_22885 [Shigella flexneri]
MVSPRSIAIACAAVGLVVRDGPVPLHREAQPDIRLQWWA